MFDWEWTSPGSNSCWMLSSASGSPCSPRIATETVSKARTMAEALELAAAPLQGETGAVVVCCGSVFVAADMRAEVARAEPALFAPTDWVFEEGGKPPLLM